MEGNVVDIISDTGSLFIASEPLNVLKLKHYKPDVLFLRRMEWH